MAVASLRYRPNAPPIEESKFGYVIFNGAAHEYHYWWFKTQLKTELISTVGDDKEKQAIKRKEIMVQVIENLRGDAFSVAMELGIAELCGPEGYTKLNEAILKHIFPVARHESKQLYKEGHKVREGVFVRQGCESMQSYILRRKRWWNLLRQLDKTVQLSTEHFGDMLLDAAGILDWQRQMILTSTSNSTEFDRIERALMEQMGTCHKKEARHRVHPA